MNSMQDKGLQVLSEITIWSKYSRYIPELQRRETWGEIVDRYEVMMMKKYPSLKAEIVQNAKWIRDKKVLPSMRAMQFAGTAAEVNNARMYNCSYLPVDSIYAFSETMFLLLGGTGVGYSVQTQHIRKLPPVKKVGRPIKYLIQDSIIGWADAVKVLMKAYLLGHGMPEFDFRDIRPKGSRLVTAGGKAPGPEPLKECLFQIQKILDRKAEGEYLSALECHDILCHIANSVLAGGIRRSACIALFSHNDEEMLTCKYGEWYELNEQRGRANNSAVLLRGDVDEEEFRELWKRIRLSGSGEPGIYWTNDLDWGTNPCCFVGETLVATADGRNAVPIEQLCKEGYVGPVYSMQTQIGQVITAHCSRVWKSRENAELVKVTLDDGSSFKCTPDHRIMLRNGQYVEAKDLTEGTSLMAFNSFKRKDRSYRMISSNTGRDIAQYAHVAQYYDLIKEGYDKQHIHHKDGNGLNDRLDNLEVIDAKEHMKLHISGKRNPVFKMSKETKESWKKKLSEKGKGNKNGNSNGYTSEELLEKCYSKTLEKGSKLSRKEILDTCGVKFLSKGRLEEMGAGNVSELSERLYNQMNHKVVSVEYLEEREDVYDMTVEGTHNFAVITSGDENFVESSGVFVHNCEIALRPFSFCNLCEMNVDNVESQEDLMARAEVAAFFGTLQAGFTDFHYLRPIWRKTTEEDALLGIGMTGICSGVVEKLDLEKAVEAARSVNKRVSGILGINPATRLTCVKPSGTTSCVLGCSSGIHAWHSQYYLRTVRFNVGEEIAQYLEKEHPELCERDVLRPSDTVCVRIPIKAPEGSVLRSETPLETLERVKKLSKGWVKPGHNEGVNTHNVSATINLKIFEWSTVANWMWHNRHHYNGISVLPYNGTSYVQMPFEELTQAQYETRYMNLKDIDLTKVVEVDDNVVFSQVTACAGGACEIS